LMNCRIFLRPWDKYLGIVEFSEALGLVSQWHWLSLIVNYSQL
jgi:hypothetical protein